MNIVDIIAMATVLLFAVSGFLLGGIVILVELLQFSITLILTLSLQSIVYPLFSYFMDSQLLIGIVSTVSLFAIIYLILSIITSFLYKFFEPFKALFLNKLFGFICGTLMGILLFVVVSKFLSKRDYFKVKVQSSYIYRVFQSENQTVK